MATSFSLNGLQGWTKFCDWQDHEGMSEEEWDKVGFFRMGWSCAG